MRYVSRASGSESSVNRLARASYLPQFSQMT
jgi:hypothetical protein